jgi:hypothetical protein
MSRDRSSQPVLPICFMGFALPASPSYLFHGLRSSQPVLPICFMGFALPSKSFLSASWA